MDSTTSPQTQSDRRVPLKHQGIQEGGSNISTVENPFVTTPSAISQSFPSGSAQYNTVGLRSRIQNQPRDLASFPLELVQATRARIEDECRISGEAIIRNVEALDKVQHDQARTRTLHPPLKYPYIIQGSEDPSVTRTRIGLQQFPPELVEQTRTRIRNQMRLQREVSEENIRDLDRAQGSLSRKALKERSRKGGRQGGRQGGRPKGKEIQRPEHDNIGTSSNPLRHVRRDRSRISKQGI
jgi:hypothetical protein